jgi:NAD(P)-dependent dehydrogenase (short-subunit alcohol dehydrogenase family)
VNRAVGRLAGKNVIITGASRGIGAAIAERFAIEGARCVLLGRNVEALTHVKEGLTRPPKADHVVKVGDVGNLVFWKEVARSEVSVQDRLARIKRKVSRRSRASRVYILISITEKS